MLIGWLLLALIYSFIGVSTVYWWATVYRVLDEPNQRSSHLVPTPKAGGIAIVVASLLGVSFYFLTASPVDGRLFWSLVVAAVAVAGISLLDDFRSVSRLFRFVVHAAAALLVLFAAGPLREVVVPFGGSLELGAVGIVLPLVLMVGLTNAYNFMDGIDGIAGAQAVVAGAGWALLGWWAQQPLITVTGLFVASSALGFLVHNWAPARIFMGDVGSAFLGFLFAAVTLIAGRGEPKLVLAGVLLVWPFVFDSAFTFIRRLLKGENVFAAHRSHLYQRLVISGMSHQSVTLLYALLALLTAGMAILWVTIGDWAGPASVILAGTSALLLWWFTGYRERWSRLRAPGALPAWRPWVTSTRWASVRRPIRWIYRIGRSVLAILIALAGALVLRFVWLHSVENVSLSFGYWDFVRYSLSAFENAILPTLGLGVAVFLVYELLRDRFEQASQLRKFGFRAVAFSTFYVVMIAGCWFFNLAITFPRSTWFLAWAISLALLPLRFVGRMVRRREDSRSSDFSHASQMIADGVVVALGVLFAYAVRFDGFPARDIYLHQMAVLLPYFVLVYVGMSAALGVYRFVWRYTGLREAAVLAQAVAASGLVALIVRILLLQTWDVLQVPFGILLVTPILVYFGLIGLRVARRLQFDYREWLEEPGEGRNERPRRLLVVGVNRRAGQFVEGLRRRKDLQVVGLLDDDPRKLGRRIFGIEVVGRIADLPAACRDLQVEEVILCLPEGRMEVERQVATNCAELGIPLSAGASSGPPAEQRSTADDGTPLASA